MKSKFEQFVATIAALRAPDGCPWDREQTHESLARYVIEESHEVLEAIHTGDPAAIKEELGDLLLQIVLHAQIANEAGQFSIEDVAESINEKMIRRHPHVFTNQRLDSAEQVVAQWEDLKKQEKGDVKSSAIDGVPKSLPALLQALKISEKAIHQGFEWEYEAQIWEKLDSELAELKEAISNPDMQAPEKNKAAKREIELEMGDVLFTLVNIGRWHRLNSEEALLLAIDKFKSRFRMMEEISKIPLKELSAKELDNLWNQAKAEVSKTT